MGNSCISAPSDRWHARTALPSLGLLALSLVMTGCSVGEPGYTGGNEESNRAPMSSTGPSSQPPVIASTAARPSAASAYPCTGYGRLPSYNTVESNAQDVYGWHIFEPVAVGDGRGDIDWDADPYDDAGWRLWLSSLRWIGPSIEAARDGDDEAFAVADRIVRDWADDHAGGWGSDSDDAEANHHRLNVLLCFREVVVGRAGGEMPDGDAWLDELIAGHVEQNIRRYSRGNNHGSMENRAILGAGCVLDRADWRRLAVERAREDIPLQVDEEGLSNEAAPHYAWFNYRLFHDIQTLADACGEDTGSFEDRLRALGDALPHMVDPTGAFWQYGDSPERRLEADARNSPELAWVSSGGTEGTPPPERVRAFTDGPVFGHASWGGPGEPLREQSSWTLRAGTGLEHKAHRGDLLQFLYTARGRQVVEDGGHPGVVKDDWRAWGFGPTAHSTIYLPYAASEFPGEGPAVSSDVVASADGRADGATVTQPLPAGGYRARSVVVLTGPDAAVVVDRVRFGDPGRRPVAESLWNLPAEYAAERTAPDTVRAVSQDGTEATTIVQVRLDGQPVSEEGIQLYRGHEAGRGHFHRGFHYPDEQVREEATQVVFQATGRETGVVSVLLPSGAEDRVGVDARRGDDGVLTLSVRGAGGTATVQVGEDGVPRRVD